MDIYTNRLNIRWIHSLVVSSSTSHQRTPLSAYPVRRIFTILRSTFRLILIPFSLLQNPFDHLYRDHDVEGMSDGFDRPTAYGHIDGIDDPSMGWARYAQARARLIGL